MEASANHAVHPVIFVEESVRTSAALPRNAWITAHCPVTLPRNARLTGF